jgi:hypothetical protein
MQVVLEAVNTLTSKAKRSL